MSPKPRHFDIEPKLLTPLDAAIVFLGDKGDDVLTVEVAMEALRDRTPHGFRDGSSFYVKAAAGLSHLNYHLIKVLGALVFEILDHHRDKRTMVFGPEDVGSLVHSDPEDLAECWFQISFTDSDPPVTLSDWEDFYEYYLGRWRPKLDTAQEFLKVKGRIGGLLCQKIIEAGSEPILLQSSWFDKLLQEVPSTS